MHREGWGYLSNCLLMLGASVPSGSQAAYNSLLRFYETLWNVCLDELWRSQLVITHHLSDTKVTYSPQDPSELRWNGPTASVPLQIHILGISWSLNTSLPWGIPDSISTRQGAVEAGHLPRKEENLVLLTGHKTAFSSFELQLPKGVPRANQPQHTMPPYLPSLVVSNLHWICG